MPLENLKSQITMNVSQKHLGSIFSTTPTNYLTKKEVEERRKIQKEIYQEIHYLQKIKNPKS